MSYQVEFSESVVSVSWNKDSTLLASADLSGLIKVWDINEKKSVIQFEEEEIEFVKFHPLHGKYLLAAQSDGNCYFYSCSDGNFKVRFSCPEGVWSFFVSRKISNCEIF